MGRFVILEHVGSPRSGGAPHWDLMFEAGEALMTWALASRPVAHTAIEAERLADHRLAYLEYEGPVSGDRGVVTRWDQGEYELLESSDALFTARLKGSKLMGVARLERASESAQRYVFTFLPNSG